MSNESSHKNRLKQICEQYREILSAYFCLLLSRLCDLKRKKKGKICRIFSTIWYMIRFTRPFFSNRKQDDPLFLGPSKKTDDFWLSTTYNKNIAEDRNIAKLCIFTLCMSLFIEVEYRYIWLCILTLQHS